MQELHDVVKIWVDCAMQLSAAQPRMDAAPVPAANAIFGRPLELAGAKRAEEQTAIAA
jgi:hypothetical protein